MNYREVKRDCPMAYYALTDYFPPGVEEISVDKLKIGDMTLIGADDRLIPFFERYNITPTSEEAYMECFRDIDNRLNKNL